MMRHPSQPLVLWILLVLSLQPGLTMAESQQTTQTMAIVAGVGFPKNRLTLEEVKAIYLGEIQILRDLRIYPIDQSYNQPIRAKFLEQILHITRDSYIDYWNKRLFQKGGFTPLLKNNSREVLETVREQEGGIGYVWLNETEGEDTLRILMTSDLK